MWKKTSEELMTHSFALLTIRVYVFFVLDAVNEWAVGRLYASKVLRPYRKSTREDSESTEFEIFYASENCNVLTALLCLFLIRF